MSNKKELKKLAFNICCKNCGYIFASRAKCPACKYKVNLEDYKQPEVKPQQPKKVEPPKTEPAKQAPAQKPVQKPAQQPAQAPAQQPVQQPAQAPVQQPVQAPVQCCPQCYAQYTPSQENGMAVAGFVCSFFVPILGWVFGGIGLGRAKKRNGKGRGLSIAAITISCVTFLANLLMYF